MELTGAQYSMTKKQSSIGKASGEGSQVRLQIDIRWEMLAQLFIQREVQDAGRSVASI